jgi:hypothetical protein
MLIDNRYDSAFSALPDLNWLPWIGKNYSREKILIVAESHYDDQDMWLLSKDATRNLVNNQGLDPNFKPLNLFAQMEKTLLNKNIVNLEERTKVWTSVAFYNLVQRLLPSPKERPEDEDYDRGWRNFLEVAEILKPSVCIKYGYDGIGRLGHLLNNFNTGWSRDNAGEFYQRPFCINLSKDGYKLRIIFTYHPSYRGGFDYAEWAVHIRHHYPQIVKSFL